ncbi:hypothetical protein OD91_1706 [Lutibacter sp. Hel_I_33_5]|uniref:TackOD1 domain-containing metal-binding protein n=1 Tax=Lutibacter sp. Hel_I_33_5 TaxID=1566289 RepID=UPI00119ED9E3|nr:hypothetical protein [Lutibacter sp. Hel_I_33_5]TVZ56421.1 hypothetical protein OD91_1706 [Lutibacter sp. Hel_I_33_5]
MLNILKKSDKRTLIHEGYELLLLSHVNELKGVDLERLDGFVIDTASEKEAYSIVKEVRTHQNIQVSLLPLFINNMYSLSNEIMINTDGTLDAVMLSSYIQRIITINKRISTLKSPRNFTHENLIQFKTLAFLYSRNLLLTPVSNRKSLIGYEYPFISLFYKNNEAISLLKNLELAQKNNYVSFKLEDYVHLCKSCTSNYLNFRECCPKCSSIDIISNDMVHHFVCAHVAPEKDFKIDDGLECPKCDKHLRHIGIDYDKPSSIYSCNSCSHEFQNAEMKALCLDCSTENTLNELLEKTIGNYKITEIGEQYLFKTKENATKQNDVVPIGSLNTNLFKLLLNQEINRIKVTNGNSLFVKIHFQYEQLALLNKDLKQDLTKEISTIIKSYLNPSDVLSANSYNNYFLLLPETNETELKRLENIQYNLTKLLTDNLEGTQQQIEIHTHKILGTDSLTTFF